ncbi:MAG: cytidylate kinase-like family protein, partial [Erysipelotrichaceae bacterium]|nr:cytidylate kinase-like family protein [Erysipelotrichaceae bacterium]
MKNTIITISRQYGSAGRAIGHQVAEKLGLECYDSQIITKIAEESGFDAEYVRQNSETTSESGFFASLTGMDLYTFSNRDTIWVLQTKIITELAEKGPCVIVGRNADYILKDREDTLHVYIHADMDYRADRIVRLYGESEKSPMARLQEKDKRRHVNYQHYTGRVWGTAQNYDICLNGGTIGV